MKETNLCAIMCRGTTIPCHCVPFILAVLSFFKKNPIVLSRFDIDDRIFSINDFIIGGGVK